MSHHASGPDFGFPRGDARLDMTDLYAFTKPGDASKSIIIFNVHPSFAVNRPGPTASEPFAPGALYELQLDTDGDSVADLNYSVQFSSSEDGTQTATMRRIHGARAARFGEEGEEIVQEADRGGPPLQAVFLAGGSREAYLGGQPADDDRFIKVFAHELEHSGGYAPAAAIAVARKLLPDALPYDWRRLTSFPSNGRALRDDVVDVFFSIYTNGKVVGDGVGPHSDLLDEFPYLGPPHESRRAALSPASSLEGA
jgi:hypothetical protein